MDQSFSKEGKQLGGRGTDSRLCSGYIPRLGQKSYLWGERKDMQEFSVDLMRRGENCPHPHQARDQRRSQNSRRVVMTGEEGEDSRRIKQKERL